MSLEAALANNTAAIRDLIEVIQRGIASQPVARPVDPEAVAKAAVEKAKATTPAAAPWEEEPPVLTKDAMSALIVSLGQRDAPAMRALMKEAGVSRLTELPQEKWPALAAAINAKLAELA